MARASNSPLLANHFSKAASILKVVPPCTSRSACVELDSDPGGGYRRRGRGRGSGPEVEREGMAIYFAAGGEKFGVIGLDFCCAGTFGAGVMEQRGAGFCR